MSAKPSAKSRRHDLDWLRVIGVLLLVPFHSALIFALPRMYVVYIKDTVQSDFLLRMSGFIYIWHMPLLFLIAGAATWFALDVRGSGGYIRERALRLIVPALIAFLTYIPFMTYIHWIGRNNAPTFLTHWQGFFTINGADLSGLGGAFTPAHLWFILFLFIFAVLTLPVFMWFKTETGRRVCERIAGWFAIPGVMFLPAVLIALLSLLPALGDKNPFTYLGLYVFGFLLMSHPRFQQTLDRFAPLALIVALAATVGYYLPEIQRIRINPETPTGYLYGLVEILCTWSWLLTMVGFGHRFLNRTSPALRYLSEAAFPVYLLHLPANTLIGWFVVRMDADSAVKYLLINLGTFALTFALYEVIRRVGFLRFAFGMKPRPTSAPKSMPTPLVKKSA